MEEQEKDDSKPRGLKTVLENWKKRRLPARFQEIKKNKALPRHRIKFSKNLKGKLFKVMPYYGTYQDLGAISDIKELSAGLHFWRRIDEKFGTYKKVVPAGEIVLATGKVGDFRIKEERQEQNLIEVMTTKGVGFIYWRDLKFVNPSVD